jgi:hypothetical protein
MKKSLKIVTIIFIVLAVFLLGGIVYTFIIDDLVWKYGHAKGETLFLLMKKNQVLADSYEKTDRIDEVGYRELKTELLKVFKAKWDLFADENFDGLINNLESAVNILQVKSADEIALDTLMEKLINDSFKKKISNDALVLQVRYILIFIFFVIVFSYLFLRVIMTTKKKSDRAV